MGVDGEDGTHHDAPITHVELWFCVEGVWVGRVVLTMTLLSHMLSCGFAGTSFCLWSDTIFIRSGITFLYSDELDLNQQKTFHTDLKLYEYNFKMINILNLHPTLTSYDWIWYSSTYLSICIHLYLLGRGISPRIPPLILT